MSRKHLFLIGVGTKGFVAPSSFYLSKRYLFLLKGFLLLGFEVKPRY
ncbi:hypothetical protein Gotur_035669 [Gossypium turneri]